MQSKISTKEAFEYVRYQLEKSYEDPEAASVARIVVEEISGKKNFSPDEFLLLKQLFQLEKVLARLVEGEPVQYVLGTADFLGLKFLVTKDVLIPRLETEELVDWVLQSCKKEVWQPKRILDIGSGSGCISVLLKKNLPDAEVAGLDVSEEALDVARKNAKGHKTPVHYFQADLLEEKNWKGLGQWHLIVSNPPYIPVNEKKKLDKRVRQYEPGLALFVPADKPLLFYEKIMAFAFENLVANGWVYLECHTDNAQGVRTLFREHGAWSKVELKKDIAGRERMVRAQKLA